jgi:hypothetical protein
MSIFTDVGQLLEWIKNSLESGAGAAGKTMGLSVLVVIALILPVVIIASITIAITYFVRRRKESAEQPGFVRRATTKSVQEPEFLQRARDRNQAKGNTGNNSEPEFIKLAKKPGRGGK